MSISHTAEQGTVRSRGQAAVEMLSYLAFFLIVFVAVMSTFLFLQSQETARAENAYAKEMAFSFSDSIQRAFMAGDGFSQSVAVPRTLLGKEYTIAVSHAPSPAASQTGLVYIWWNSDSQAGSFSAPTVTANYYAPTVQNGFIVNNGNMILINSSIGTVNMTNDNGLIKFTQG